MTIYDASENADLRRRLAEAEETIRAIRAGEVDALIVTAGDAERVFVLEGADQMYRVLVEGMQEGAGTLNDRGLILYCNDRFAEMVELPVEAIVGQPILKFVDTQSAILVADALDRCRGERIAVPAMIVTPAARTHARLAFRDLDASNGTRAISFVASDLTPQSRARHQQSVAALAHEGLLASSINALFDHVCREVQATLRADFVEIVEYSPSDAEFAFRAAAGWSAPASSLARFPGEHSQADRTRSTRDVVVVSDARREQSGATVGPFSDRGIVSGVTVPLATEAGELGVLGAHWREPREFSDAEVAYLGAVARVLSAAVERKQFEDETVRSREELRLLLEESPDAIIRISPDRRLQYTNRAAVRWILKEANTAPHVAEALDLPPAAIEQFVQALDAAVTSRRQLSVEIEDSAHSRWWDVRIVPGYDTSGNVAYVLAVARDVTTPRMLERERATLRAQVERSQRVESLGRLSTTIAHEFNNVLMGIQPFAELLLRPGVATNAAERYAKAVLQAVERGKRTTNEVLRSTRNVVAERSAVPVAEWLEELRMPLVTMIGSGTPLDVTVGGRSVCAFIDRTLMDQVLTNLVLNARDAAAGHGTIRVAVSAPAPGARFSFAAVENPERYVHLTVTDQGGGIAPEHVPHIFDPLFTTKRGGTGLGLAVVQQIVTSHGGLVFVETELGRGTTIHLFIPRCDPATLAETSAREPNAMPAEVKKIVMVEDDASVWAGMSELLALEGISVDVAETGGAAGALIEKIAPDLVVLDVGLPDIDGLSLFEQIHERWPRLPVIFSTGHADVSRVMAVKGRVSCLTKPYEFADFVKAVNAVANAQ